MSAYLIPIAFDCGRGNQTARDRQTLSIRPYSGRFLRRQEVVTIGVALDALDRLAGVMGHDFVEFARRSDFLGVDGDVRGLALEAAHRLVDHHARIGQGEALALGAGRQQERAHRTRLPEHSVDTSGLMNCIVS